MVKQMTSDRLFIAGPCSVESEEQIQRIAKTLSGFGIKYLRGGTFKSRTSPDSFQGLGYKGLELLKELHCVRVGLLSRKVPNENGN